MRRRERRSEYAKGRGCASTRGKKFPRTHTRIFTFVLQTHRMMKIEKRKKHPPRSRRRKQKRRRRRLFSSKRRERVRGDRQRGARREPGTRARGAA